MHIDEVEQQTGRYKAAESMDTATVGDHAEPMTPHASEKKKQNKHTNKGSHPKTNMEYQIMQKTKNSVMWSRSLPTTAVFL
ncbi:hypothetical protein B7P43_G08916 [Cryptotermes secundus]|uniref:Uncharacterized protein n=1 Tax=Cryptotermes secundus TaxID=105785 RepID=A0A2J7QTD7_9NEOP|nr:hypothetical protein B7P43_G08916 [Cryptotermes secundus]